MVDDGEAAFSQTGEAWYHAAEGYWFESSRSLKDFRRRVTSVTDQLGRVTNYEYDSARFLCHSKGSGDRE